MAKIGRFGRDTALEKEQMIEVYEASGRSGDPKVLQELSDKMFPDTEVKWYRVENSFKGFVDQDGVMHKAKFTLGTGPNWIGILENDMALPY